MKKLIKNLGRGFKKLQCKYCKTVCQRVDEKSTGVTCSICTSKLVAGKILELRK